MLPLVLDAVLLCSQPVLKFRYTPLACLMCLAAPCVGGVFGSSAVCVLHARLVCSALRWMLVLRPLCVCSIRPTP